MAFCCVLYLNFSQILLCRKKNAESSKPAAAPSTAAVIIPKEQKTAAQRTVDEILRKRVFDLIWILTFEFVILNLHFFLPPFQQDQKIEKLAAKSHKEKVAAFNKHLDSISEHFDIPRVWTLSSFICHLHSWWFPCRLSFAGRTWITKFWGCTVYDALPRSVFPLKMSQEEKSFESAGFFFVLSFCSVSHHQSR